MQTEYLYPQVADRRSVGDWEEGGRTTIYRQAYERVKKLLSTHYPEYIGAKADARIREKFPIRLEREDMTPGNGRW
jgi:trimethylamine--corrinoid protein Co-methyltransferase